MAITRAQQAKQMLQNGGMLVQPGFGGARQGYRGDAAAAAGAPGTADAGPAGDPGEGPASSGDTGDTREQRAVATTQGFSPTSVSDLSIDRTAVGPKSTFAANRNRRNIDRMFKGLRETISPSTKAGNRAIRTILNIAIPGSGEFFASNIDKAQPDIFGTKTDDDDDNNKNRGGDGDSFMPIVQQRPMMSEPEITAPVTSAPAVDLNRIAYRLMADGGAVIDDEPRQAYGLGSIVKKATRAVKKVVKSDVGKAAIAAAGIYYAGGGNLFGLQRTTPLGKFAFSQLPGASIFSGNIPRVNLNDYAPARNIFQRGLDAVRTTGTGKAIAGIAALSALPLLGVGVEEEEEEQPTSAYLGEGLDIAAIRANPRAFQGQAYRLMAEGGDTEDAKEPVAKKVMPLIDMDGKEKDYRETGGFVDIGRMEKADDVPARLSKNEFVFTADAVRNAGDGSVDKGAEVMYNMMKNLEAGGEVSEESQGLEGARKMFQTSQRLEEVL